jgi:hypothetical protein
MPLERTWIALKNCSAQYPPGTDGAAYFISEMNYFNFGNKWNHAALAASQTQKPRLPGKAGLMKGAG